MMREFRILFVILLTVQTCSLKLTSYKQLHVNTNGKHFDTISKTSKTNANEIIKTQAFITKAAQLALCFSIIMGTNPSPSLATPLGDHTVCAYPGKSFKVYS